MKAILVVDIPNDLSLSDLYIFGGLWEAWQDDGWAYEFKAEDIKPMPNKKEENDDGTHFSWHSNDWWSAGWNACLEEIEKC